MLHLPHTPYRRSPPFGEAARPRKGKTKPKFSEAEEGGDRRASGTGSRARMGPRQGRGFPAKQGVASPAGGADKGARADRTTRGGSGPQSPIRGGDIYATSTRIGGPGGFLSIMAPFTLVLYQSPNLEPKFPAVWRSVQAIDQAVRWRNSYMLTQGGEADIENRVFACV